MSRAGQGASDLISDKFKRREIGFGSVNYVSTLVWHGKASSGDDGLKMIRVMGGRGFKSLGVGLKILVTRPTLYIKNFKFELLHSLNSTMPTVYTKFFNFDLLHSLNTTFNQGGTDG